MRSPSWARPTWPVPGFLTVRTSLVRTRTVHADKPPCQPRLALPSADKHCAARPSVLPARGRVMRQRVCLSRVRTKHLRPSVVRTGQVYPSRVRSRTVPCVKLINCSTNDFYRIQCSHLLLQLLVLSPVTTTIGLALHSTHQLWSIDNLY